MTTTKQAQTNRRNAKKSTGPKTAGGKLISSKNAVTYGIFSTSPLLPFEDVDEFEALKNDIATVFPPVDVVAASLVERIVLAILRQKRLRIAEAARAQLATAPEVLAIEINSILRIPFTKALSTDSISKEQEVTYSYWHEILEQFKLVDIATAPIHLDQVSAKAPKVYAQLKQIANKSTIEFDIFMETPHEIIKALERIKNHAQTFVENNTLAHRGFQIAEELRVAKLIPDGINLALLSKYQVQLDTDLYRAIDAYKTHMAWRSEVLEAEVEVTES